MDTVNRCDGCTACCDVFPIYAIEKPANSACKYCDKGCTIQETKPQECALFECAYYQSPGSSLSMRPDKCGIIFEKISDKLFFGTAFKTVSPEGVAQVHAFVDQGFSVILVRNTGGPPKVFFNPQHNPEDIRKALETRIKDHGDIRNRSNTTN